MTLPFSRRLSEAALLAAASLATVGLWIVSRGKWSDAIIDSGTEWIYADALARGQVLYRDVVYWFGPFTPYFQTAFALPEERGLCCATPREPARRGGTAAVDFENALEASRARRAA